MENKKDIKKEIDLSGLPRITNGIKANIGKIDWKNSIGYKIKGVYNKIYYEFEIMEYKNKYLTIKYANKTFKIFTGNLVNNYLGKILGEVTIDFKIEIGKTFKDSKRNIVITDREYRKDKKGICRKWYKYTCNLCGWTEGWIIESSLLTQDTGCGVCCSTPRVVVLGINTIYDTDTWMIPYIGEECAKTHTHSSGDKVNVTCLDCGRVKSKKMKISEIYISHSIGCSCSDGKSYISKYMFNILEQLKINFDIEIKHDWCNFYNPYKNKDAYGVYDFVIEEDKLIIETDGGFHRNDNKMSGQTKDESKFIDNEKDRLAYEYGYKVVRISDEGNIKENILDSDLSKLFDLSKIDWLQSGKFASSNLVKIACEYKRNNPNMTTKDISEIMKYHYGTITRWLKQGTELSWCNYNTDIERQKASKNNAIRNKEKFSKKVEIFKDGISLGIFPSMSELERQSEKLFGVKLTVAKISLVCLGRKPQYKGFTFKYVEEKLKNVV